jgi:ATP-binding cassette subfamily B protein
VLLLRRGRLVDFGTHDELLGRTALYRRIFAHYDEVEVPGRAAGLAVSLPGASGPTGSEEGE